MESQYGSSKGPENTPREPRKDETVLGDLVRARVLFEKTCYAFRDAEAAREKAHENLINIAAAAGEIIRMVALDPTMPPPVEAAGRLRDDLVRSAENLARGGGKAYRAD